MMDNMKHYRSKADFIMILLVIFAVIGIFLFHYMLAGLKWVEIPLHTFLETLGVFAGFTLALLLLIRQKQHNHGSYYIFISSALISMSILDGFHAADIPGNNFVWLHSIAVLSGGFLVFMVLFSKRIKISHDIITLPTVTAFVAIIIGGLSIAFPEAIPAMLSDGTFTFTASAINIIGGILFICATIYFVRNQGSQENENIYFALFCLLNGLAALFFPFSTIWNAEWWLWHVLRITAYFVLLVYVFVMYRRTDKALKESENRLKSAMDLAKLVHWEYDVDSDMFTFDDQFYALYGTSADEEGGNKMSSEAYASKFIPPEESALVGKEVAKAIETHDPNYVSTLDHKIIRADGKERYITVSIRVIKDAEGRTIKTYGANQDITERKQAEKALQERNN